MTLSAGVVSLSELRTDFDAQTASLTTNASAGQKDQTRFFRRTTLLTTDALNIRTTAWVMPDDMEGRVFALRVTDTAAGATVTATVEVDGGDTRFLVDNTVSISVAAINGTVDSRTDFRTVTGVRFRFKKGVRYRITVATVGADVGVVVCAMQMRSVRRTR